MSPHRAWSSLPCEILELFLYRLPFADHARFAAVCAWWRSAAADTRHHRALRFPWLLLPGDPPTETWTLFSPMEGGRVHHLNLPSARGCRCFGSSMGWLMMAHDIHGNHLLNPFTNRQIPLPHGTTIPVSRRNLDLQWMSSRNYFVKAVMSSAPSPENLATGNCVVVAFYDHSDLATCRPGDDEWTSQGLYGIMDFIFFKGLLYCVTDKMEVIVYDSGPQLRFKEIHRPPRLDENFADSDEDALYLVESAGELLLVMRHLDRFVFPPPDDDEDEDADINGDDYIFTRTYHFSVFKLDWSGPKWIQMTSLGDEILFLGTSGSRSFTAADCPGFRRNCIYFTDDKANYMTYMRDRPFPDCDWGVFSLEDSGIWPIFTDFFYSLKSPPLSFLLNA